MSAPLFDMMELFKDWTSYKDLGKGPLWLLWMDQGEDKNNKAKKNKRLPEERC